MTELVSLDDFGTGILAGLALEGIKRIKLSDRLDAPLVKAFQELEKMDNVDVRFYIMLDKLHGDAPEARRAIGGAISRGLGIVDSDGVLHIGIPTDYADRYFESLPLSAEQWRILAKIVLEEIGR